MSLYKLKCFKQKLSDGILLRAEQHDIDYERSFECWLGNSPNVLFDEGEDTVIWVGRQETVQVGDVKKFPDLIGTDSQGDVIIVELKKGRTPREMVAQGLEYASWASSLKYEDLNTMFKKYCLKEKQEEQELSDYFNSVFNPDSENDVLIEFNRAQKLFLVAEEVSPTILQVCNYLKGNKLKVFCMEYTVQKTASGDIFVSTERKVWLEPTSITKIETDRVRWGESEKVKDVIYEAVKSITNMDLSKVFSPSEVYRYLVSTYPNINCGR